MAVSPEMANGAGCDTVRTASHRDLFWRPFLQHLHLWPANHRLQKVCICWRSSNHACWWRLAGSGMGADQGHGNPSGYLSVGAFNRRELRSCLVPQCSHPPYWPAINDALRNVTGRLRPTSADNLPILAGIQTCWTSSQWSHTVSSTPCHGAWTPAPLNAHPSIECKCTAPQIETPICTSCTTTHQFIWKQQHTCGALGGSPMECGVGGQPYKTPHFHSRHRRLTPWNDPPKKSLYPA